MSDYPCGCRPGQPCQSHFESNTCPECGRPLARTKGVTERLCLPTNCSVWKVVGKGKNGGPILRLVESLKVEDMP